MFAALAPPAVPVASAPDRALPRELSLICIGEDASARARDAPARQAGAPEPRTEGQPVRIVTQRASDVIELSFVNGSWRVRGPARLVPIGNGDGWRPLRQVRVDNQTVSGVVALGLFSRAALALSRSTGHLTLTSEGLGYSGMCDTLAETEHSATPTDAEAKPR